jgi:hypothetical protein
MTRQEKKMIRMQIHNLLEENCQKCQHRYKTNACVRICPSCQTGRRIRRLGRKLEQNKKVINGKKRRSWTEEEDFYLIHHYSIVPVKRIAERLGRTPMAVIRRAYVLRKGGKFIAS